MQTSEELSRYFTLEVGDFVRYDRHNPDILDITGVVSRVLGDRKINATIYKINGDNASNIKEDGIIKIIELNKKAIEESPDGAKSYCTPKKSKLIKDTTNNNEYYSDECSDLVVGGSSYTVKEVHRLINGTLVELYNYKYGKLEDGDYIRYMNKNDQERIGKVKDVKFKYIFVNAGSESGGKHSFSDSNCNPTTFLGKDDIVRKEGDCVRVPRDKFIAKLSPEEVSSLVGGRRRRGRKSRRRHSRRHIKGGRRSRRQRSSHRRRR